MQLYFGNFLQFFSGPPGPVIAMKVLIYKVTDSNCRTNFTIQLGGSVVFKQTIEHFKHTLENQTKDTVLSYAHGAFNQCLRVGINVWRVKQTPTKNGSQIIRIHWSMSKRYTIEHRFDTFIAVNNMSPVTDLFFKNFIFFAVFFH